MPSQLSRDQESRERARNALVAQSQKRSAVYDIITNPTNVAVDVKQGPNPRPT
jgi:hypothetical protein